MCPFSLPLYPQPAWVQKWYLPDQRGDFETTGLVELVVEGGALSLKAWV